MALTKVTYSMINGAPANVLDFGAIAYSDAASATSGIDCAPAFNAAFAQNSVVLVPAGYYRVDSTIVIPNGCTLQGSGVEKTNIIAGLPLANKNIIESQSVHNTSGGTDGNIVIQDIFLFGGDGATTASGIELGTRYPLNGQGVTFSLARIGGYYLQNGIKLNGATYSTMSDIRLNGLDARSSGVGVYFDKWTNNVRFDSGLIGDFGYNMRVNGDQCVITNVNLGTAIDGAYGAGWANTWTQCLLEVAEGRHCKFSNCTFEYLSSLLIDEVVVISYATNPDLYTFELVFEDCYWVGITAKSRSRMRLGVAGPAYKTVAKVNMVRCEFIAGVPVTSTRHGDIWIDNATNSILDKCVSLSDYQDTGTIPASVTYTSGLTQQNSQTRVMCYFGHFGPYVIGTAGAPAFQNSWASSLDPQFGGVRFDMDNANYVTLNGILIGSSALSGTVAFTLPVDFRPAYRMYFPIVATNGASTNYMCFVDIRTNGEVYVDNIPSGATNFPLDGIQFFAEQ